MTFMKRIAGPAALGTALLLGLPFSALAQPLGFTVTLSQVGNNVVATGSGVLDLTGLTFFESTTDATSIDPQTGTIITGTAAFPNTAPVDLWISTGDAIPQFGSGSFRLADSGTGDMVGMETLQEGGTAAAIVVPQGYVSGTQLSSTATWLDTTIDSLGIALPSGDSVGFRWGPNPNFNNTNFQLVVGELGRITVPEPASVALLGTALAGLVVIRHRKRRARLAEFFNTI